MNSSPVSASTSPCDGGPTQADVASPCSCPLDRRRVGCRGGTRWAAGLGAAAPLSPLRADVLRRQTRRLRLPPHRPERPTPEPGQAARQSGLADLRVHPLSEHLPADPGEPELGLQSSDSRGKGKGAGALCQRGPPARHTPRYSAATCPSTTPAFLGATGTPDELARTAKAYGVFYAADVPTDPARPDNYNVTHSAYVYLIDQAGRWRAMYGPRPTVRTRQAGRRLCPLCQRVEARRTHR